MLPNWLKRKLNRPEDQRFYLTNAHYRSIIQLAEHESLADLAEVFYGGILHLTRQNEELLKELKSVR